MSMNSKVNATLRSRIIESLNVSPKTNAHLYQSGIANPLQGVSLRAIQEATQKMTKEGTLVVYKSLWSNKTFYKIAPVVTPVAPTQSLAASA